MRVMWVSYKGGDCHLWVVCICRCVKQIEIMVSKNNLHGVRREGIVDIRK
jgi:hypothetical protein